MIRRWLLLLACFAAIQPAVMAAATTNHFSNPEFDDTADPWTGTSLGFGITYQSTDSDSCPGSGSVRLLSDVSVAEMRQCVAVTAGEALRLRIRERGSADVIFQIWQVSSCGASEGPGGILPAPISSLPTDAWVRVETPSFVIPAGWTHANVYIRTTSSADVDRAFFGDPADIFLEDFEVGDTCHFSATVP